MDNNYRTIRTQASPLDAIKTEMLELKAFVGELKEESKLNRDLLLELIKQLSPTFPPVQPTNDGVFGNKTDVGRVIATARNLAPAPVGNPNLRGPRDINPVVPEILEYWINSGKVNSQGNAIYPDARTRLLGLINFSMKSSGDVNERGYAFNHPIVVAQYKALRKMCLVYHQRLLDEYYYVNDLAVDDKVVPAWSRVDEALILKHALYFEAHAQKYGFILHRCTNSWGATALLASVHKTRRRSATRAIGSTSDSSSFDGFSSSFSLSGNGATGNCPGGDDGPDEGEDDDDNEDFRNSTAGRLAASRSVHATPMVPRDPSESYLDYSWSSCSSADLMSTVKRFVEYYKYRFGPALDIENNPSYHFMYYARACDYERVLTKRLNDASLEGKSKYHTVLIISVGITNRTSSPGAAAGRSSLISIY
ncbi:Phospholipid metabolism protein [Mucor velutinosus]|uniref:Phospholipid metabolism protein n=2 Tax=Mucor velutinosus TaxID=708070 RepID=A0AAN7HQJ1_9FUNG|nr:Phospholipid metabolism protein [Mucor velutinosus]